MTELYIYSVLFVDPRARCGVRAGRIPKSVLLSIGSQSFTRLHRLSLHFDLKCESEHLTIIWKSNNIYGFVRNSNFVAPSKIPQLSGVDWTRYVYHTYFLIVLVFEVIALILY